MLTSAIRPYITKGCLKIIHASREGLQWKAFLRNEKSLERKARQPETEAKANAEARVTGGTPK
jgi:hypothetical protein